MLPPKNPPSRISSLSLAVVAAVFSAFSIIIFFGVFGFPSNAPVEGFLAVLAIILFAFLSLSMTVVSLSIELLRKRYQEIVLRYSGVTGDMRYNPYVMKPNLWVIVPLCVINVLAPLVIFLGYLTVGGI